MSKELSQSLRGLALQIALELPDNQRQAICVLRYAREIVERGPEKSGHGVRAGWRPSGGRAHPRNIHRRAFAGRCGIDVLD
jgi:hypothetical protein